MSVAETLASFPLAALALVRTLAVLDSNWQKREKYYGALASEKDKHSPNVTDAKKRFQQE